MRMKLGAKKKTHSRNAMPVESQFQLKRRRKFPPSDTSHTTTNRGRPRVAKRDVPTPRGSSINCAQFNVCYVSSITRTKTRRKEDSESWEEMGRGRHARYFTRLVSRPPPWNLRLFLTTSPRVLFPWLNGTTVLFMPSTRHLLHENCVVYSSRCLVWSGLVSSRLYSSSSSILDLGLEGVLRYFPFYQISGKVYPLFFFSFFPRVL